MARNPDVVDELVTQWARQRPDLAADLPAMALFGRLARFVAHGTRSIEAVFAEHGLNVGEFDVLAALRRAGDGSTLRPTELARILMLSPAGMTNRIDRLEAAGWVERRADPDDRRSSLVALTPQGREVVDLAVTDHLANEVRLLEPLTPTQRATLDDLLRKLLTQFG